MKKKRPNQNHFLVGLNDMSYFSVYPVRGFISIEYRHYSVCSRRECRMHLSTTPDRCEMGMLYLMLQFSP